MEQKGQSSSDPVTALIVRYVRMERIKDFEEWALEMNQVVKGFKGYLGTDIIRPRDHSHPEYVIVVRFDKYENLKSFMESTQREEWLKKSEEMTVGKMYVQEAQGFTPWFVLPDFSLPLVTPQKYKMALLTILALYPSLLILSTLLSYLFHGWPRPLLMLLTVLILVPIMTYYIMPLITRLFRFWLYPKDTAS
ncbi:MAG: antibiotic biosynthesis monooxygenase [Chloroflexota bacterium]|nr:MAG: antibiotic biosynthesis monooxygenase [Chloroflexota bacterium]